MSEQYFAVHEGTLYLYHHGIKGQKWGVRRFQNPDGTRTPAGKKRKALRKNLSEKAYEDMMNADFKSAAENYLKEFRANKKAGKNTGYEKNENEYVKKFKKESLLSLNDAYQGLKDGVPEDDIRKSLEEHVNLTSTYGEMSKLVKDKTPTTHSKAIDQDCKWLNDEIDRKYREFSLEQKNKIEDLLELTELTVMEREDRLKT